ncbi:hypothetical protein [Comamonas sp. 7D-2evo1]|uniref:hypothetical protein n=3 Tax=unclassified Comamonas TaxID=2638500 RepID=UPI001FA7EDDB|nr:hypothetical protein [Comamonas sp. 7D-2evo1]UNV88742.1 hypothetical protein MP576_13905 [Comamonas sp. 7D-2evo1]
MSEQSTVDGEVLLTEPSVPPPPPPDVADLPPAVSVAPEVTGVDDSAVDHSWLSELETAAPLSGATATASAAAAPVEAEKRPGFLARAFGRAPAAAKPRKAEVPVSVESSEIPSRRKATNPWVLRAVGIAGVVGILALGYLQYGQKRLPALDLLGSSLPEAGLVTPQPAFDASEFDPRLADTSPLPLAPLADAAAAPIAGAPSGDADPIPVGMQPEFDPEAVMRQSAADAGVASLGDAGAVPQAVTNLALQRNEAAAAAPAGSAPITAAPAPTMAVAPTAVATATPVGVDPQVLDRMKRMEDMMLLMSQQLAAMQQANALAGKTSAAPAPAPAVAPAAAQAAPVEQPSPRPAPKRVMVKAKPATPRQAAKVVAAKPAAAPAGAQLVSVDMWNGEPSVVVASGVPGDRRVRVLRPGDVVNGLSLKSADPVSRTATFVAPGSQGLTLSVSNGG